jgi:hypothetical protein
MRACGKCVGATLGRVAVVTRASAATRSYTFLTPAADAHSATVCIVGASRAAYLINPRQQRRGFCANAAVGAMDNRVVTYAVSENVATITLNNHAQRNPLSREALELLEAALQNVNTSQAGPADERVLAVVLKSVGSVFSSGHDFAEFSADVSSREQQADILDLCTRINVGLQQCGERRDRRGAQKGRIGWLGGWYGGVYNRQQ